MERNQIQIDDIGINIQNGKEFSFEGLFSNKKLAGINLKLERVNQYNQQSIETLLKEKKVHVYDPFVEREYKAEITQRSNSFTVGSDVKSYDLVVKEIDEIPYFEKIEINGVCFSVLSYQESITSNTVSRQGVLMLTKDQFKQFRELLSEKSLEVRRVGIDEKPFEMRFGSSMFWSEHSESDTLYFKHIFRLFEKTLESSRLNLASGIVQNNAANMLVNLTANFESMVEILKLDDSLSDDTKNKLANISNNELSSKEILNNLYDKLEKVRDAEKHFK